MPLNKLFHPFKIGQMALRNRVIMGSMHVGLEGEDNNELALTTFYSQRAKHGGPALIVTGGISVSIEGEGGSDFLGFYREKDRQTMKAVTDSVHQVGGKIAAQLFHAGRYSRPDLTGVDSVAPSVIRSPIHRHVPKALTHEEVLDLIQAFRNSAVKAMELGFDAVEIMGSEGYLINQFLSPVTNQRDDDWGGSFEMRLHFAIAILKEIREGVGGRYPIIFRLSGDDLIPGSTSFEETVRFAKLVEESGADALNIGIGWHESRVPTISTMVSRAGFISIAENIKKEVNIPVIGSNRINDPQLANQLLEEGRCDIVSMARPFLADPDILQKAYRGEFDRINTCVACNQACLDHIFDGKSVSCIVNPLAGREHQWRMTIVKEPQKIAVIGGGVAGMEAARALSEAGHLITLFESASELGGQLLLAKEIPGKEEFAETLRYYKSELNRLGVNVLLNHQVVPEDILDMSFNKVILSIGVKPRIPNIPGMKEHLHVYTYHQVLSGQAQPVGKVIIIGAGGIGCDMAHYLIGKGLHDITLMRRNGRIGQGLGKTTGWALLQHLKQHNVRFLTGLQYDQISADGIEISKQIDNRIKKEVVGADTIIIAAGQESTSWDEKVLVDRGIEVVRIGGARLAGELDAERAIYEGASLAYS